MREVSGTNNGCRIVVNARAPRLYLDVSYDVRAWEPIRKRAKKSRGNTAIYKLLWEWTESANLTNGKDQIFSKRRSGLRTVIVRDEKELGNRRGIARKCKLRKLLWFSTHKEARKRYHSAYTRIIFREMLSRSNINWISTVNNRIEIELWFDSASHAVRGPWNPPITIPYRCRGSISSRCRSSRNRNASVDPPIALLGSHVSLG